MSSAASSLISAEAPNFSHAVIIGYGVIGASMAQAMHQQGLAERISAWDKNGDSLAIAVGDGVLHCGGRSQDALEMMLADADLVVFALPPQRILEVAQQSAHAIPVDALVMDVASVKQPVADALRALLPNPRRYVPAHPIAGAAGSGASFASPDLFLHRAVMLSPEMGVEVNDPALLSARNLWEAMGSEITLIPSEVHDAIYAYVSHLPQAMAFAAGHALLSKYDRTMLEKDDILRRFLRLNISNAELWAEIFTLNTAPFCGALETAIAFARHFAKELSEGHEKDETKEASAVPPLEVPQLFSRIAASCVVMTVLQLERNAKMKVARFAGAGFADFCAPAIESPEPEFERISAAWKPLLALLNQTIDAMEKMLRELQTQQTVMLKETIDSLRAV